MTDNLPWPQEWCEDDKPMMYQVQTKHLGSFQANLATIKFCLKRNHKLVLGCFDQQAKIEQLRDHFPTALFVLIGDNAIEIRIRDKKELE